MRKIRALHIVQSLPIGGLERITSQIVSHLSPEVFDPEVWCLTGGGPLADSLRDSGVPVKVFGYRRYLLPWNILSIAQAIRRGNFDIVHTHSYPPSIVGRIAAALAGVPVRIYHYHTTSSWHRHLKYRVLEKATNNFLTDGIIACSHAVKNHVVAEKLCSESLVSVIYNGVERDFARTSSVPAVRTAKTVLTVASLTPHKGHLHLLHAATAVLKNYPDVRFIFVGDGPEKEKLHSFARDNGFAENLHFAGIATDVRPFLEAADIFVLPSLREGMPISIVEAMAHRLPVIASDVGGIPEVVVEGQTGFLIKPGDHGAMAARIIGLLEDRNKRETLGRNGYDRFLEKFTLATTLRDVQELYLRLLAAKKECHG